MKDATVPNATPVEKGRGSVAASQLAARWQIAIICVLGIVLAVSIATNAMQIAPSRMYATFQYDSDGLVMGKVVSDRVGTPLERLPDASSPPNLAHASVVGETPDWHKFKTVLQGFALVDFDSTLPERQAQIEPYEAPGWKSGVATAGAGIAIDAKGFPIDDYIGRSVAVDGLDRYLISSRQQSGVSLLSLSGPAIDVSNVQPSGRVRLSGDPIPSERIYFVPYYSQSGLHGVTISWLIGDMGLGVATIRNGLSVLLAMVATVLALQYRSFFGFGFALAFMLSMLLSPWVTCFGRNLFWVTFTWMLPAVFALMFLMAQHMMMKVVALSMAFAAFLLKMLCGYDYLTTITLFAAAPAVVVLFDSTGRVARMSAVRSFMLICSVSVAAFLVALVIHARMKADSVLGGLKVIFLQDALRRTHGNPADFTGDSQRSLSQSLGEVLWRYAAGWRTDLILGIPGNAFLVLIGIAGGVLIARYVIRGERRMRELGMCVAFLAPALSWHVLAKGHSANHYHMNYVLWYLGGVAAVLYTCGSGLWALIVPQRVAPAAIGTGTAPGEESRSARRRQKRGAKGR